MPEALPTCQHGATNKAVRWAAMRRLILSPHVQQARVELITVLLNSQRLKWLPRFSGHFLVLSLAQMNGKPN